MDTLKAACRGNGLTALEQEKNIKLTVFPGGKFRDMTKACVNTVSSLPPTQTSQNSLHFLACPTPPVDKNFL